MLMLAVNPTVVKKAVISIFCKVVSKFIYNKLLFLNKNDIIAKENPPTTGAGMQYF
ncbi:hypothetical protein H477_5527 [[Clostridium] sordellii ATCC 9714]|nr:hypothetical protein H477_5527 [[Clostridium] sordellii ATCC 9714] [Paeniclostridium sordellii ATCC 9714]